MKGYGHRRPGRTQWYLTWVACEDVRFLQGRRSRTGRLAVGRRKVRVPRPWTTCRQSQKHDVGLSRSGGPSRRDAGSSHGDGRHGCLLLEQFRSSIVSLYTSDCVLGSPGSRESGPNIAFVLTGEQGDKIATTTEAQVDESDVAKGKIGCNAMGMRQSYDS